MIPLTVTLKIRKQHEGKPPLRFRLWIPLFLVWLLLLPLVLVLLPFYFVACIIARVDGLGLLRASWQILGALRKTNVEVESRDSAVMIRIP